jgi:hypothetical protein
MEQKTYFNLEEMQAQQLAAHFVINSGGKWDETNSRIHCCEVFYRDSYYIEQRLIEWACSIREAYEMARDAWLAEVEAGRAL